jgi:hypothetical protein
MVDAFFNFTANGIKTIYPDHTFGGIDTYDNDQLNAYRTKIDEALFQLYLAEAKTELFIDDEELLKMNKHIVSTTVLEISHLTPNYFREIRPLNIAINAHESPLDPRRHGLSLERSSKYDDYTKILLEKLGEINPKVDEFRLKSREYLNSLFEK